MNQQSQSRSGIKEVFPQGQIKLIVPGRHGLIESHDGRHVRFFSNSVIGADFQSLRVGDQIRFSEEPDQKEPRASTVFPVDQKAVTEW